MTETPYQIARREIVALAKSRGVWIGLGATGVILGLAGPFGTDDVMRTLPRLIYWVAVAAIGFFAGSSTATLVAETLRGRGVGMWPAVVVAGAVAGVVNFALLAAINTAVFGPAFIETNALLILAANVVVISIIIAAAYVSIQRHVTAAEGDAMKGAPGGAAPEPPRLLARMPLEKRGRLIAISVQDHYVEVVTDKGAELILLRLGDAMEETGHVGGMQVHRSHWIATGEVVAAKRDGARAILTMSDGRDIPVSRTYVPAVKEAGLLP
ncbi:MAG: LytTR family DNA-binding domain-containing protein [Pseudomonadota bacterium]|nr:LytTR family DNA-binding domain-containing protein [Pseudomonadota bacterium]